MIKLKKIIGLSLAMIITFTFAFFSTKDVLVFASASGNGWSLDSYGNLIITSDAGMVNWSAEDNRKSHGSKVLKVDIAKGVAKIESMAFRSHKNLQEVNIANTVTFIDSLAFYECEKLKSIVIPEGVKTISNMAFERCTSLESVYISASVQKIYASVFTSCTNLKKIVVDKNNKYYTTGSNGELFNKDMTILVQYPIGNPADSYVISDNVRTIEPYAFDGANNLVNIKISKNVGNIGECAFAGCSNISKVILPNGVKDIKYLTFINNNNLTEVIIPDSVLKIGWSSFLGCSQLSNIEIPDSVTEIEESAFEICNELTNIVFRSKLPPVINGSAFEDSNNIKFIYVPIGTKALYTTELEDKIPADAKIIEVAAEFTLGSANIEDGPITGENSKDIIVFLPIIILSAGYITVFILRQRKKIKAK